MLLQYLMVIFIALTSLTPAWADMLLPDNSPATNPQWVTPSDWNEEQAWLESLIGRSVYYYGKDEDGNWNDESWSEGAFSSGWTYAVLKYGVGKPGALNPDHWAIMDDDEDHLLDLTIIGLSTDRLSHITYFGTTATTPIPEPVSMLLMGAGLMTWAALQRRRAKRKGKRLKVKG